jgi:protein translocase SecG subunit
METFSTILPYIEIGLAVVLVVIILVQRSSSGLGSAFGGGGDFAVGNYTRRGGEKTIFYLTIIIAVLFVASVIADSLYF